MDKITKSLIFSSNPIEVHVCIAFVVEQKVAKVYGILHIVKTINISPAVFTNFMLDFFYSE